MTDGALTKKIDGKLRAELDSAFDVHALQDGGWSICTPLIYGDGDGLPIVLERHAEGWRFTDRGSACGHLYFDDFEVTPAHVAFLRRLAASSCVELSESFVLTSIWYEDIPSVFDLADFIQDVAMVQAVRAL